MVVIDSRVKSGTLTFGDPLAGGITASCQPTAVSITPTDNAVGEAVEVLCGDQLAADATTTWALVMTAIQDWTEDAGLVNWSWQNDQSAQAFEWAPQGAAGPTYSGTVVVKALMVGGAVATRNLSEATWPINGQPVRTPVTP